MPFFSQPNEQGMLREVTDSGSGTQDVYSKPEHAVVSESKEVLSRERHANGTKKPDSMTI